MNISVVMNWTATVSRVVHIFKFFAGSGLIFELFSVLSVLSLLMLIRLCMKNSFSLILSNGPHHWHELFGVNNVLL